MMICYINCNTNSLTDYCDYIGSKSFIEPVKRLVTAKLKLMNSIWNAYKNENTHKLLLFRIALK